MLGFRGGLQGGVPEVVGRAPAAWHWLPRMCGRPAAAPYPGLRPSAVRQCERGRPAAVHCPGVRPCKRGEPAAVPYPGVRPRKRGRPAHALLACAAGLRRHLIPCERGEPAAVPYPGVRPRLHAVQVSCFAKGKGDKNVYPPRLAFPIYEASSLLP